MESMFSRTDIRRITGVSMKALRGYEELGLVKPTQKNKYWYYSVSDLITVCTIQMYTECGMARNEVKALFEKQSVDACVECDRLLVELERKKHEIDARMDLVHRLKAASSLEQTLGAKHIYNMLSYVQKNPIEDGALSVDKFLGMFEEQSKDFDGIPVEEWQKFQLLFNVFFYDSQADPLSSITTESFTAVYKAFAELMYTSYDDVLDDEDKSAIAPEIREDFMDMMNEIIADGGKEQELSDEEHKQLSLFLEAIKVNMRKFEEENI